MNKTIIFVVFTLFLLSGCNSNPLSCDNPEVVNVSPMIEKVKYDESQIPDICKSAYLVNSNPNKDYELSCVFLSKEDSNDFQDRFVLNCECKVCEKELTDKEDTLSQQKDFLCEKPSYIEYEEGKCCLDANKNGICDGDEGHSEKCIQKCKQQLNIEDINDFPDGVTMKQLFNFEVCVDECDGMANYPNISG